ncbi:hypothetical protein PO002_17610 [Cupriavidus necator]|uniref:hypothetical protein n=1 Tax=Cupriavidus necator TaxID=106590 RepID=UPI0039C24128
MKKILAIMFWLHSISHTFAATLCDSDAMACMLYSERSGSLVDRDTGKVVAHRIGNVGAFSDVSVYKYGNQYAIVQENHSNDRLVTAVPLTRENGIWSFDSVYYFSISLIESSAQTGPRWLARKLHTRKSVVDDDILLRAGELASERRTSPTKPDGWPNTKLYLATDEQKNSGRSCFIPFESKNSPIPVGLIACRSANSLQHDGAHDLSGVIGRSDLIVVSLTKNGNEITGRYQHLDHPNQNIKLRGILYQDGTFEMTAHEEKGDSISGFFNGSIDSEKLSGEWRSGDKLRILPFSIYAQGFSH